MTRKTQNPRTLTIRSAKQRRAIASPLRMEILGLFVDGEPLSVALMAQRMGRPASAIHYHVRLLEEAGLLRRTGRRRSGRRPESLYLPVADLFRLEQPRSGQAASAEAAVETLATAFRMAERDMRAALTAPEARSAGPQRNFFGARVHCRLAKKDLAELNRRLQSMFEKLTRTHRTHKPKDDDAFVSLTIALMPLRDREVRS